MMRGGSVFRRNGSQIATGDAGDRDVQGFNVGIGDTSNYFSGAIGEILWYGSERTSQQRDEIEQYLSDKWGGHAVSDSVSM